MDDDGHFKQFDIFMYWETDLLCGENDSNVEGSSVMLLLHKFSYSDHLSGTLVG